MKRILPLGVVLAQSLAAPARATAPVAVELFESQGCSSCPPAERTMEKLEQEFGPGVLLMTFHVHYWDHLGWKDTFSDSRFTDRQNAYARSFNQDTVYTPEMVINGEVGFTGSDDSRARREIRQRLDSQTGELTAEIK